MTEEPRRLSAYGNVKIKRRRPKRYGFLKGMLIFAACALFVIAAAGVVFWKYVAMYGDSTPDRFVKQLSASTDENGWRQLLRQYLPATYPEYGDASELAYKVLSPELSVGNVTWLRRANPDAPEYMFFSDGIRFAVVRLRDKSGSRIGLGEWEIDTVSFDIGYFGLEFPETRITCPAGAQLTLNGTAVEKGSAGTEKCAYPALSPGEAGDGPECVCYVFDDVWFAPEVSCTYKGKQLECVKDETGHACFFLFPKEEQHSITVTVPASVTAFVGGKELTEEWAAYETREGELGSLDDGGTGTKPMLGVWTVDGLFGETPVRAEVYGKEVALLSDDGGNYIFDTPAECKYRITICVPSGASVRINGKAPSKKAAPMEASEIGIAGTVLGSYDVADLAAAPDALPAFEKYELEGYLALPNVSVTYADAELEVSRYTADAYDVKWEYDYPESAPEDVDSARVGDAQSFLEAYVEYMTCGGAWNNPDNEESFNMNYEALKARMIEGTSGFVSVMESYREVNRMPHYDSFTLSGLSSDRYIAYSDGCVSCRVSCQVLRTIEKEDEDGFITTVGSTADAEMNVLQVFYNGEWRVWGFIYNS